MCLYGANLSLKIHAALLILSNSLFQCSAGSFEISVKWKKSMAILKRTPFEILGLIGKSTDQLPVAS